jgi:hypothetical protein
MTGTDWGKPVAGEVGAFLVVVVFSVVGVAGLHDEEPLENCFRQVEASQWSFVVPHWGGC